MALPTSSADIGPSFETSALISRSQKELKECMTEHLDAQKAWTQQELDEIKSFNLRMDQRIAAIAEATLEAKSIATAARIRAEDDDSALTLDMEERVESIEERMACQSQEVRLPIIISVHGAR